MTATRSEESTRDTTTMMTRMEDTSSTLALKTMTWTSGCYVSARVRMRRGSCRGAVSARPPPSSLSVTAPDFRHLDFTEETERVDPTPLPALSHSKTPAHTFTRIHGHMHLEGES